MNYIKNRFNYLLHFLNKQTYLMKKMLLCFLAISLFSACQKDPDENNSTDPQLDADLEIALNDAANGNGLSHFILPDSDDFGKIPQDPNNTLTSEKVKLGKMLYHETGLAVNPMNEISEGTFSCASCHFAQAGFQAGRFQGISEGGVGFGVNGEGRVKGALYQEADVDVQAIRTPSAMNIAYQPNVLWNGQFGATELNVGTESEWTEGTPKETNHLGFEGTEIQAIAGLGVHRLDMDGAIVNNYTTYKNMFDDVFSDLPESERYSKITAGLAIAAYERTLLSNEAPFQKYLKGDKTAMTDLEKKGALVFFEKSNCANCHNGPALNEMDFHAYGMNDLFTCPEEVLKSNSNSVENKGRGGFTGNADDMFKFKVPQLYNMADSPFFGHGSSMKSIREVVEYKNKAIAENPSVPQSQLSEDFVPQNLSDDDVDALVAFLENALRDPNLMRYVPESLPSGNCFPFNDPLARNELGCD